MKRAVQALVVSFILILTSVAFSESVDFDSYNLEELLRLRNEIDRKIESFLRKNEYQTIYSGLYESGRDIASGEYILTNISDDYSSGFLLLDDMEHYLQFQQNTDLSLVKQVIQMIKPNVSMHIRLDENDVLFISPGLYSIRKAIPIQ